MVSPIDIISPLTTELAVGGVGGFLVGYALRKVAKIIAILTGLGMLGLYTLVSQEIIEVNSIELGRIMPGVKGQAFGLQVGLADLFTYAPFVAAFIGGLYLGFRKG